MKKLIIIKYGELTTKHDNINFFIKTLKNNIESILSGIDNKITYDVGRMFIETDDNIFDGAEFFAHKSKFGSTFINIFKNF